jgi:predicted alpha/beta-hydrolase family hydrolase
VDAPDIVAARNAALSADVAVARVTQPYRVAGRRAPAPAPRLDEAWIAIVERLQADGSVPAGLPVILGGRSSGARVACRTADALGAEAVVALAFPVHPPGRPERDRLAELAAPRCPVLVVQGDRDPFGMPPAASGRQLVVIQGGDHSLRQGLDQVAVAVADFLLTLT